MPHGALTDDERRFADAAVGRKGLFLALSLTGIVVATALAVYYGYRWALDRTYPVGLRSVVIVLVLLNARQNLRQYRYAALLEKLVPGSAS